MSQSKIWCPEEQLQGEHRTYFQLLHGQTHYKIKIFPSARGGSQQNTGNQNISAFLMSLFLMKSEEIEWSSPKLRCQLRKS